MLNGEIQHPNTHLPVEKQPQVNTWKLLYISNAKWAGNINKTKQKISLKPMMTWQRNDSMKHRSSSSVLSFFYICTFSFQQRLFILSILLLANDEVEWSVKSQVVHWTIIKKTTLSLKKKKKEKIFTVDNKKKIFQRRVGNIFFLLQKFLQSYLFLQWQIKYVGLVQVLFFFFFFLLPTSPPFIRAVLEY